MNTKKYFKVPANLLGYHYLTDAIQMCVDNDGILQPVTKIIYPDIASKYKTRPSRVARAIRHAIFRRR